MCNTNTRTFKNGKVNHAYRNGKIYYENKVIFAEVESHWFCFLFQNNTLFNT